MFAILRLSWRILGLIKVDMRVEKRGIPRDRSRDLAFRTKYGIDFTDYKRLPKGRPMPALSAASQKLQYATESSAGWLWITVTTQGGFAACYAGGAIR